MKFWRLPLDSEQHSIPKGRITIIESRCKGCNFCIEFCPRGCLVESAGYNAKGYHPPELVFQADECVSCGLCSLICPEFAIFNERVDDKEMTQDDIKKLSRKMVRED